MKSTYTNTELTLYSTEPVSYTHLDVYKRQHVSWPGYLKKRWQSPKAVLLYKRVFIHESIFLSNGWKYSAKEAARFCVGEPIALTIGRSRLSALWILSSPYNFYVYQIKSNFSRGIRRCFVFLHRCTEDEWVSFSLSMTWSLVSCLRTCCL